MIKKKFFKPIVGILFTGILIFALFKVLPIGMPSGDLYFKSIEERELQKDEIGQFNYVYDTYKMLGITGDEFPEWDTNEQILWRYGIAFASYAMPSISIISPKYANPAKYCMKLMIEKMKSRKIWGDWIDYGMGNDPISEGNIMYKGHLNLMFGLYQLMTSDTLYAKEYTWLTNKIVEEMRRHHREGKHEGADCEPGRYFAQCNSISLLSLKVYDKLYGTNFTENESQWTIDFIKTKMTDDATGLYKSMYNTEMNFCNPYLSGYTNAWSMSFLHVVDEDYNKALYKTWKDIFVKNIGPYALVKEDPEAGASPLAHMNGLLVAKEFGDKKLFTKLRNTMDKFLYKEREKNYYKYKNINNAIYNGPILWTKVHLGWNVILNYDWGTDQVFSIPDVSNMQWTDILDTKLKLRIEDNPKM